MIKEITFNVQFDQPIFLYQLCRGSGTLLDSVLIMHLLEELVAFNTLRQFIRGMTP